MATHTPDDGYITIPWVDWVQIQDNIKWLAALEAAGVDNWDGIDYASELYNDYRDDE